MTLPKGIDRAEAGELIGGQIAERHDQEKRTASLSDFMFTFLRQSICDLSGKLASLFECDSIVGIVAVSVIEKSVNLPRVFDEQAPIAVTGHLRVEASHILDGHNRILRSVKNQRVRQSTADMVDG